MINPIRTRNASCMVTVLALRPSLDASTFSRTGPFASFKIATVVNRLPKTRSGKIVRGTIKKMADGIPYTIPPTIEDAAVIDEIKTNLSGLGYPRKI